MQSHSFPFELLIKINFDHVSNRKYKLIKCSDHIALLKAFEGYKEAKRNGRERAFCWENFLSPVTLQMIEDMRTQFIDQLSEIGFVDKSRGASVSSLSYLIFLPCISLFCASFFFQWLWLCIPFQASMAMLDF